MTLCKYCDQRIMKTHDGGWVHELSGRQGCETYIKRYAEPRKRHRFQIVGPYISGLPEDRHRLRHILVFRCNKCLTLRFVEGRWLWNGKHNALAEASSACRS